MALNDKPQMQHLPLNSAQKPAELVTDDRRFNPCVALNGGKNGKTLTLNLSTAPNKPATLSVWFKRQSPDSQIQLGPAAAHVRIGADGTVAAYQNQQLQGQPFVPLNSAAKVTDNQWHYLTWVKQADQHTLYLNGIVCATRTLPAELTPAAVTTITVLGGPVRLAQLHYYPRALTVTEVLADQHSQNQAKVTFVDQYPLDFALAHIKVKGSRWENFNFADNTLVVEDFSGKERLCQHLKITNVSREAVEFPAGQGDAGSDNYHFELRLRNGTFSEPQTYPRFTGLVSASRRPLANWSIIRAATQNADDGSWSVYLLSTQHLVLASGAALAFPFEYTTADGSLGGRPTRVALHYQGMQFKAGQPVQGTREKSVDIMNLSSNNSYLQQVNARVSEADSKVDRVEGSVKKDIKSLENLAKAEEDTGALQEFASKQGKQNKSKGKSSKIKPINAGKKGQSFASAVVATIKSLAANVEALDDEVDERAKATAVIQDQLEKPFPLVASLRTSSTGIVCNNRCDFTLEITNISHTPVDFEAMKDAKGVKVGEDVKVAFTIPLGAHRSDTLAASHSAVGEIKSVTVGQVTVSPSKQNAELKLATDGTSVITLNLLNLIEDQWKGWSRVFRTRGNNENVGQTGQRSSFKTEEDNGTNFGSFAPANTVKHIKEIMIYREDDHQYAVYRIPDKLVSDHTISEIFHAQQSQKVIVNSDSVEQITDQYSAQRVPEQSNAFAQYPYFTFNLVNRSGDTSNGAFCFTDATGANNNWGDGFSGTNAQGCLWSLGHHDHGLAAHPYPHFKGWSRVFRTRGNDEDVGQTGQRSSFKTEEEDNGTNFGSFAPANTVKNIRQIMIYREDDHQYAVYRIPDKLVSDHTISEIFHAQQSQKVIVNSDSVEQITDQYSAQRVSGNAFTEYPYFTFNLVNRSGDTDNGAFCFTDATGASNNWGDGFRGTNAKGCLWSLGHNDHGLAAPRALNFKGWSRVFRTSGNDEDVGQTGQRSSFKTEEEDNGTNFGSFAPANTVKNIREIMIYREDDHQYAVYRIPEKLVSDHTISEIFHAQQSQKVIVNSDSVEQITDQYSAQRVSGNAFTEYPYFTFNLVNRSGDTDNGAFCFTDATGASNNWGDGFRGTDAQGCLWSLGHNNYSVAAPSSLRVLHDFKGWSRVFRTSGNNDNVGQTGQRSSFDTREDNGTNFGSFAPANTVKNIREIMIYREDDHQYAVYRISEDLVSSRTISEIFTAQQQKTSFATEPSVDQVTSRYSAQRVSGNAFTEYPYFTFNLVNRSSDTDNGAFCFTDAIGAANNWGDSFRGTNAKGCLWSLGHNDYGLAKSSQGAQGAKRHIFGSEGVQQGKAGYKGGKNGSGGTKGTYSIFVSSTLNTLALNSGRPPSMSPANIAEYHMFGSKGVQQGKAGYKGGKNGSGGTGGTYSIFVSSTLNTLDLNSGRPPSMSPVNTAEYHMFGSQGVQQGKAGYKGGKNEDGSDIHGGTYSIYVSDSADLLPVNTAERHIFGSQGAGNGEAGYKGGKNKDGSDIHGGTYSVFVRNSSSLSDTPTTQFKALKQFLPRETIALTIDGCTPNNMPGTAVVQVKYSGLSGYPDAASSQAIFINKEAGMPSPLGSIIMWSGTTLPVGWVLCDGNNGTPDLSNRFIVSSGKKPTDGKKYEIGDIGGQNEVLLTKAQMPSHDHTLAYSGSHSHRPHIKVWRHYRSFSGAWGDDKTLKSQWGHSGDWLHEIGGNTNNSGTTTNGNHTHSMTESGGKQAHENRPPYYALAFIMRKS